jgi:tryptophan 2,3-dioxygenase
MAELTYASYLQVDRLLELQEPRSKPPQHDEMLFIVIHQVYELWFKQMLHEIEKVKRDFTGNDLWGAMHTLGRVRHILKVAVAQLDILETMTPMSFAAFRDRLETASGFQSVQFREFEFVLGYRREGMVKYHAEGTRGRAALERRLRQRSLYDHFYDFLQHQGVAIPDELRGKPVEESTRSHEEVQAEILRLYRSRPDLAGLFEVMTDIDEGIQEWRYRHVKLVERTIGNKKGTGGSLGVAFLKETLFHPVFPDLWEIRHEL